MSKIKVNEIEAQSGSTITIPTGQTLTVTDGMAASTITSGTLADARLPTIPVSKGGTGLTSLGTANQVVAVNSGASALEFQTVSSDFVKIYSAEDVAAASEINLNGYFDYTKYHVYKILYSSYSSSGGQAFNFRARTGTNGATEDTGNEYYWAFTFRSTTSGGQTQQGHTSGFGSNARIGWNGGGGSQSQACHELTIHRPDDNDTTHVEVSATMWDNSYFGHSHGAWVFNRANTPMTGIKLYHGAGNIGLHYVNIYGLKK